MIRPHKTLASQIQILPDSSTPRHGTPCTLQIRRLKDYFRLCTFDARDGDHRGPDCRKRDTVLAAVKDAARRLQRWPDGRSGRKNGPGVEQKN